MPVCSHSSVDTHNYYYCMVVHFSLEMQLNLRRGQLDTIRETDLLREVFQSIILWTCISRVLHEV